MWLFLRRAVLLKNRRRLGGWGEKYALKYLKGKGYIPLAFNFRTQRGEVDLIIRTRDGVYVFIEVKTRGFKEYISAVSAVGKKKQRRIIYAATEFIRKYNLCEHPHRYDIITIVLPRKGKPKLTHYERAYAPD